MIFQLMFAIITPALMTGAFAERMKFSSFLLFSFLWATIIYDPLAHWVWGVDGWLHKLGALDFAGGTVVHISSGASALVAVLIIGKRVGFGRIPTPPHNLPFAVIGASLLWFGWFGFNAGSALGANGLATSAMLATHMAAAVATLTWVIAEWIMSGETYHAWRRVRRRGRTCCNHARFGFCLADFRGGLGGRGYLLRP